QINEIRFKPWDADTTMSWEESLWKNYTDGIVVLHEGKIVYERYFGCLTESGKHAAMSVTKSFTGTLASMLVAEGKLDPAAKVATIIPELKNSAFGDATVRQVMNMTTSLQYSEDYANPDAQIWTYAKASNPLDRKSTRLNSSHVSISYAVSSPRISALFAYTTLFRSHAGGGRQAGSCGQSSHYHPRTKKLRLRRRHRPAGDEYDHLIAIQRGLCQPRRPDLDLCKSQQSFAETERL